MNFLLISVMRILQSLLPLVSKFSDEWEDNSFSGVDIQVSKISDPFVLMGFAIASEAMARTIGMSRDLLVPLDYNRLQRFSVLESGIASIVAQQIEPHKMHIACVANSEHHFATFTQDIARSNSRTWLTWEPQILLTNETRSDPLWKFAILRCFDLKTKWDQVFTITGSSNLVLLQNEVNMQRSDGIAIRFVPSA